MADTTISAERQPLWRVMVQHPAHVIALGFGAGLVPLAPGTAGTLVAFPMYWLLAPYIPALWFVPAVAVLFVIGIWACELAGRAIGKADHGAIVWDEVVAFLLVLFFTPAHVAWQAYAFVLFRMFDIFKPPPIRHYDRTLQGGFGVMFDDAIAAFYTLIVLAITRTLTGS